MRLEKGAPVFFGDYGYWRTTGKGVLDLDLADPMQLNHIAHFTNLSKGAIELIVVANVYSQVNYGCLSRESLDLSIPHVDVVVTQPRENIFENADPIDYFNLHLYRVGEWAGAIPVCSVPTDGNEAIARYIVGIDTALPMNRDTATSLGHNANN